MLIKSVKKQYLKDYFLIFFRENSRVLRSFLKISFVNSWKAKKSPHQISYKEARTNMMKSPVAHINKLFKT